MKILVTLTALGAGLAGLVAGESPHGCCPQSDCSSTTAPAAACRPEVSCTPDGTCRIECTGPDGKICWVELDCDSREVVDRSGPECGAPADCSSDTGCTPQSD